MKLRDFILVILTLATAAGVNAAYAADLTGPVRFVADGDTFDIGDTAVRLCGIDAPEKGEAGYMKASAALKALVEGKTVRCVQVGDGTVCDGRSKPTSYDRIVAQCFVGDQDIAASLVAAGVACDWTRFSGGYYSQGSESRCDRP